MTGAPMRIALIALAVVACAREPFERVAAGVADELLTGFEPTLEIRYDQTRREIVLESAPVDLPAGIDHHGAPRPPAQYGAIPVTGWLHGMHVELVDGNGRDVPRAVLHHVNIISPERRELFSDIMQRVGAAGHETESIELPSMLGYPVREGERLIMTVMYHNPTSTSFEGVRVRVRMPHSGPVRRIRPIEFFPFYLDVMPPASVHQYDVPPGGRHEKTWEGSPAVSGRILALGGHLHDNGVALRLENLTTGKLLWETRPILDEEGRVSAMPQDFFFHRFGIPIRRDHVYRLTAIYENDSDEVLRGAMGAVGGIIAIPRSAAWPDLDSGSAEFALDIDLVRTGGMLHDMMDDVPHGGAPSHNPHGHDEAS